MSVDNTRYPTVANAIDFAEITGDKRDGARVIYNDTTEPTLEEINKKLIRAEEIVFRALRTSYKAQKRKNETMWFQYQKSYAPGSYYFNTPAWYKSDVPTTVNLTEHPIISIDSIIIIVSGNELDIVADSSYSEGWSNDYYIDYQNGIVYFKNTVPAYNTPVKVTYYYGVLETDEGNVVADYTVVSNTTETTMTVSSTTSDGEYNGKLIEFTSGTADGETYRILSSTESGGVTTLTVLNGYTMITDGVLSGDTFVIYSAPPDIIEMVVWHAFLSILTGDPTYQFTFTNPPEEFAPQYAQFEGIVARLMTLMDERRSAFNLLN